MLHEEISQNYLNETRKVKGTGTIPQQLVDWFEEQVKGPSAAFFHETIQQHLSGLIPNATTFNEVILIQEQLDCLSPHHLQNCLEHRCSATDGPSDRCEGTLYKGQRSE